MNHQECVNLLNNTLKWRPAIVDAARIFKKMDVAQIEAILQHLIDDVQDKAVGILLDIISINHVKIKIDLLCESLRVVDHFFDFCYPFFMYDDHAIQPLLDIAMAEDLPWERQAIAVRLAAELSMRFNKYQERVRKCAMKLDHQISTPEAGILNIGTLNMLDDSDFQDKDIRWFIDMRILNELPEEKPAVVTGGDYTVRRVVQKIGRNDPCHCGSGKKYKHCCYNKDLELERDASQYEGMTRKQVLEKPDLVNDSGIIENMRPYALKKLVPEKLNDAQLFAAYQRADIFNLHDIAYQMLVELKSRPEKDTFASDHLLDLLDSALRVNRLDLVKKIKSHIPEEMVLDPKNIEFQMHMLKHHDYYQMLEDRCREALKMEDTLNFEHPLLDLGFGFENLYPALSIVFLRSAILSKPDRFFDNSIALDSIRDTRLDLDLNGLDDPIEDYLDWIERKEEVIARNEKESLKFQELQRRMEDSQKVLNKRRRELTVKEQQLERLANQLKKKMVQSEKAVKTRPDSSDNSKNILDLRRQVENLKAEIRNQQEERSALRRMLNKEKGHRRIKKELSSSTGTETGLPIEKRPRTMLIPEFGDSFQKTCRTFPNSVISKALKSVVGFAAHDPDIWKHTKKIEELTDIYRIRIGMHYRLLLEWHRDKLIRAIDLIKRENLEKWIKNYSG